MDAIKKYGYTAINVLMACGTLFFFFTGVMGSSESFEKREKKVKSLEQSVRSLGSKKPAPSWYEAVDENVALLEEEKSKILSSLIQSDDLIQAYYNLDARDQKTMDLPEGRYPEFKEMLQEKWNILKDKERSGLKLMIKPEVLTGLEPSWLRSFATPSQASEVSEAMKRYWIVMEILRVMDTAGVAQVLELSLSEPQVSELHQVAGKPLWSFRDLAIKVKSSAETTMTTFKAIDESQHLMRMVSFSMSNQKNVPHGIETNADFLSFESTPFKEFSVKIRHFDLLREGEELVVKVGEAKPSNASSSRRRRR